tara:strand:+ start:2441 stop:2689 length:249 start_codon:yes stop_codon:yes gene_type:complete
MKKQEELFSEKLKVENPKVLIRENKGNDFYFRQDCLVGVYYRVFPSTAREIMLLQNLRKNIDVYLPADEDGGLIISPLVLPE